MQGGTCCRRLVRPVLPTYSEVNAHYRGAARRRNALDSIIRGRRAELHRRSRPLGERLFAESPDRLVARFGQYWEATSEYECKNPTR